MLLVALSCVKDGIETSVSQALAFHGHITFAALIVSVPRALHLFMIVKRDLYP